MLSKKKINDTNLDGIFRLILIYGKNMKKCIKIYVEHFKKFHDKKKKKKKKKKNSQHVQKTEHIN